MARRVAVLVVVMMVSCNHLQPVPPPAQPVPTPCDDDVVVALARPVIPCPDNLTEAPEPPDSRETYSYGIQYPEDEREDPRGGR